MEEGGRREKSERWQFEKELIAVVGFEGGRRGHKLRRVGGFQELERAGKWILCRGSKEEPTPANIMILFQ